mmetsp:Transcript_20001/g.46752  ORF Transcript_20001/g.46752 Transcript_20001/m.46752 type:complete len:415 (-) Transcript_20001:1704-2948(-)
MVVMVLIKIVDIGRCGRHAGVFFGLQIERESVSLVGGSSSNSVKGTGMQEVQRWFVVLLAGRGWSGCSFGAGGGGRCRGPQSARGSSGCHRFWGRLRGRVSRKSQGSHKGRSHRRSSPGGSRAGMSRRRSPGRWNQATSQVAAQRRRSAQQIPRRGTPQSAASGGRRRSTKGRRVLRCWGGFVVGLVIVGIAVFSHTRGGRRSVVQRGPSFFRRGNFFPCRLWLLLLLLLLRVAGTRCFVVRGHQSQRERAQVLASADATLGRAFFGGGGGRSGAFGVQRTLLRVRCVFRRVPPPKVHAGVKGPRFQSLQLVGVVLVLVVHDSRVLQWMVVALDGGRVRPAIPPESPAGSRPCHSVLRPRGRGGSRRRAAVGCVLSLLLLLLLLSVRPINPPAAGWSPSPVAAADTPVPQRPTR